MVSRGANKLYNREIKKKTQLRYKKIGHSSNILGYVCKLENFAKKKCHTVPSGNKGVIGCSGIGELGWSGCRGSF